MGKKANLAVISIATIAFFLVNLEYPNEYIEDGFYTFLSLAIIYAIFKVVLEDTVSRRIRDSKARYSFRKIISILFLIVFLGITSVIWIESTQSLVIMFGIAAAGIAVALQDFFKNFVGGILIFLSEIYRVGDRIEIDKTYGDVIDIGIMYTTLLELREWVKGDQATGRLTTIPNGKVLSTFVYNYTKDHNFIWDEISLPITYDSDHKAASDMMLKIVRKETMDIADMATDSMKRIGEKYFLSAKQTESTIFYTMTDNWVTFDIRYITRVDERRIVHDRITRIILEQVQKADNIKIASETMDITAFPEIKMRKS